MGGGGGGGGGGVGGGGGFGPIFTNGFTIGSFFATSSGAFAGGAPNWNTLRAPPANSTLCTFAKRSSCKVGSIVIGSRRSAGFGARYTGWNSSLRTRDGARRRGAVPCGVARTGTGASPDAVAAPPFGAFGMSGPASRLVYTK